MNEMRRAALSLHGLVDSDREWVLSRLPEAQRGELRELVDELRELGFPKDAGLVQPVATPAAPGLANRSPVVGTLEQVSPKALFEVLQHESPAVISTLLGYRSWRWSRGLLRRFKRKRRRAITDYMNNTALSATKRVQRELLESVAALVDVHGVRRLDNVTGNRSTWQK